MSHRIYNNSAGNSLVLLTLSMSTHIYHYIVPSRLVLQLKYSKLHSLGLYTYFLPTSNCNVSFTSIFIRNLAQKERSRSKRSEPEF